MKGTIASLPLLVATCTTLSSSSSSVASSSLLQLQPAFSAITTTRSRSGRAGAQQPVSLRRDSYKLNTRFHCSNNNSNMSEKQQDESSSSSSSPTLQFGRFTISPEQIFYTSPSNLSAAIVNLRPIVPGHVLVISTRVVPHLADLTDEEYVDLWLTARKVQDMLTKKYFAAAGSDDSGSTAAAFNVAVQDGRSAGQSVPHVHVHILPRVDGDFERNDDVYDELEAWAPTARDSEAKKRQQKAKLEVLDDAERVDRTMEQMGMEAEEYRKLMM